MRGFATLRRRRLTLNFVPRISSFVHSNSDLSSEMFNRALKNTFFCAPVCRGPHWHYLYCHLWAFYTFCRDTAWIEWKNVLFSSWLIDVDFLIFFINNQPLKTWWNAHYLFFPSSRCPVYLLLARMIIPPRQVRILPRQTRIPLHKTPLFLRYLLSISYVNLWNYWVGRKRK